MQTKYFRQLAVIAVLAMLSTACRKPQEFIYAPNNQQLVELGVRRLSMPSEREINAFIDPKLYRSKPETNLQAMTPEQQRLLYFFSSAL